jgi:Asp-tRNA(Asn)/Glu-tRNA(Gln) amidotransferase A subunit family amidase
MLPSSASMLRRFEDWWRADRATRRQALSPLPDWIREHDADIHAWVQVQPQPPTGEGPLADIPFGVKDIIETANLLTEYGSPIYRGRQGTADAAIVARLRRLGGVLMGKTHAAAFACRTPPPTRNPRDREHTPGGSSSGSAAAVAADMVPFAVGTQTHGSVLRPASYCGVTGFKPSYGLLSTEGVLPVARSLDTLGFFTHTVDGMLLLWEALGESTRVDDDRVFGVPEGLPDVDPAMERAFERAVSRLRDAGFDIRPIPVASRLAAMPGENRIVECFEGARVHEERYREHGDRLMDVADMVREGLRMPVSRYEAALAFISECRAALAEQFASTPAILTPAATGPAPKGLASTGDARMNSPWTALGTPAVTIPLPVPPGELPLGLQVTAAHGCDARALGAARRIAGVLTER